MPSTEIELTSLGGWMVESDEGMRLFSEKKDIAGYVFQIVGSHPHGSIHVREDVGARSWFERVALRMHPRILRTHFAMEWSGAVASLIFRDELASEYRAKDSEQPVFPDEQTRKAIAHGELSAHPLEQCIALDRTLRAIEEYLQTGFRPPWLIYDYVR